MNMGDYLKKAIDENREEVLASDARIKDLERQLAAVRLQLDVSDRLGAKFGREKLAAETQLADLQQRHKLTLHRNNTFIEREVELAMQYHERLAAAKARDGSYYLCHADCQYYDAKWFNCNKDCGANTVGLHVIVEVDRCWYTAYAKKPAAAPHACFTRGDCINYKGDSCAEGRSECTPVCTAYESKEEEEETHHE